MSSNTVLNVKSRGQGSAVVLLHGLFGRADNLSVIARALEDAYAVYSFDLPAHGDSPLQQNMSLSNMARLLAEDLTRLQLQSAHIVGHSLGGKLAMQLVALYPELARSLVVMDIAPVAYSHGHDSIFQAVEATRLEGQGSRREIDAQMARFISEPAVRQFIMSNLGRRPEGGYAWRIDFDHLREHYAEFAAAPEPGEMYRGPVLVIKGEQSDYIRAEHEAAFRQRFDRISFREVQGTGHWLHAEKPDVLSAMIRRFIDAS